MRLSSILKSSLFAVAATVLGTGAASAGAITTWNPSAVGLTGGAIVGFDNFTVSDFARIQVLDGAGHFVEDGVLNVKNGFLNGSNNVATPGLGSTYSLYYVFHATGTQGGPIPVVANTTTTGFFSTLTYTLYATPNSTPTYTVGSGGVTITGNAGAFALATGTLVDGTLGLTKLKNGGFTPFADVTYTVDPCLSAVGVCSGNESAFFVSPAATAKMFEEGNFGATSSQTSLHNGNEVWIVGGGGNITQEVPEPFTLSLFGAGLAGAAAIRRRKAKKA